MAYVKKYDVDFSKRKFIENTAAGFLGAGVLCPVWSALAENGDFSAAYPDELLSIENYTKGALKTGDTIDSSNVDMLQDLLDGVRYTQIKQMGRKLEIVPVTTDIMKLSPVEYTEATLRNKGLAKFDAKGNVVVGDGKPWIGGTPFPEPRSGVELFANITLTWGRHDVSFYPIKSYEQDKNGRIGYK